MNTRSVNVYIEGSVQLLWLPHIESQHQRSLWMALETKVLAFESTTLIGFDVFYTPYALFGSPTRP